MTDADNAYPMMTGDPTGSVEGQSLPNSTLPTIPGAADGYGGSAPAPLTGVVNPPEEHTRVQILKEAAGLITGDRQEEYGTPQVNFQRIATMFQVLFPEREWTPADIAIAMLSLKLARGVQGYKRDTAVDAAGYAALWAELSEG